jgi:hypothetical protein
MLKRESPATRYRRLAQESLKLAKTFPLGKERAVSLQMAQVWQRLADQHAASTLAFSQPGVSEQPAAQQQQQVQPTENSGSHVVVMQSAKERMRRDATNALNRTREGRIFVQRSVRSQIVVIAGIGLQNPA